MTPTNAGMCICSLTLERLKVVLTTDRPAMRKLHDDYVLTGLIKLLKSRSLGSFQSGIIGPVEDAFIENGSSAMAVGS